MACPRIHIISCAPKNSRLIESAAIKLQAGVQIVEHESNDDFLDFGKSSPAAPWEIVVTDLIKISMPLDHASRYMPVIHFVDDWEPEQDPHVSKTSNRSRARILIQDIEQHLQEAIASANLFIRLKSGIRKLADLDERERSVVFLAAEGIPNKTIARRLDVSIKTVEHNRRKAFQKLDVKTTAEAASLVTFNKFFSLFDHPNAAIDLPTYTN